MLFILRLLLIAALLYAAFTPDVTLPQLLAVALLFYGLEFFLRRWRQQHSLKNEVMLAYALLPCLTAAAAPAV